MAKELNEKSIKDRLEVLENDITKVSEQMVSLDKQKSDAIAMLNALNGAKQQCMNFLKDISDEDYMNRFLNNVEFYINLSNVGSDPINSLDVSMLTNDPLNETKKICA